MKYGYLTIAVFILYESVLFYFLVAKKDSEDENRIILSAKLIIAGIASVFNAIIKMLIPGIISIILIILITAISFICIYKVKELPIWEE